MLFRSAPEAAGHGTGAQGLVGDIGGTHARFGWLNRHGHIDHVRTLRVADHSGPASAVRAYLSEISGLRSEPAAPLQHAALALATTVSGDAVAMTNAHWRFSCAALQAELGLRSLSVLNDFEALALALPGLRPDQLRRHVALPMGAPNAAAPRLPLAVIGPGTGLGVAGVLPTARGWQALPGEGGHATLSAADAFEAELLAVVRRTQAHVSAERLLSGIGLPLLLQAVAAVLGQTAPELDARQIVERGTALGAVAAAADPMDALCARTLDVFCALLGGFAGNVALTLGARGGVFIGGGIVPRLGERFFASQFRARFEAKGRFQGYLQAIPTAVITDTLAALGGAAAAIAQAAD